MYAYATLLSYSVTSCHKASDPCAPGCWTLISAASLKIIFIFIILSLIYLNNADLAETVYDRSALPVADFYNVTDFYLRKRGNEVFFNVSLSMQSGTQFDPNTLYLIGPSPALSELIPSKVYFLNGYGCDSNWENPIPISTYVDTSGYVRYCASSQKTYFKISGHWIVE